MNVTLSFLVFITLLFMVITYIFRQKNRDSDDFEVIRVAVIGGMTMTNLWGNITEMFHNSQHKYRISLIKTSTRPVLSKIMEKGEVDFLTQHSGDITTRLVTNGFGITMQPWTLNDLVIVGPHSDPANIKNLKSGIEAFKKIESSKSNFVDFHAIGPREMCHKIWRLAGLEMKGEWVLKDDSQNHGIFSFAKDNDAYFVMGRMPILYQKVESLGMEIMVEGDPEMRRPYVAIQSNPRRFEDVNEDGAKELSNFLISEKVQSFLETFGVENGGLPIFYPIWPYDSQWRN